MVHQPPKRPWKMLLEAGNRINSAAWRYFYLRQNLKSAGGWKEGARQGLQHPGWDFVTHRAIPQSPWEGNFLPFQWEKAERELINVLYMWGQPSRAKAYGFKRAQYKEWAERVKIGTTGSILIIQTEILIMRIANKVFKLFWVDILFQKALLSCPCTNASGLSQKIRLSWVQSREF